MLFSHFIVRFRVSFVFVISRLILLCMFYYVCLNADLVVGFVFEFTFVVDGFAIIVNCVSVCHV